MGFDTETNPATGDVLTAQFSGTDGSREIFECHGQPALVRAGFARILQGAPPRSFILAGAHYLRFDISVLFKDTPDIFAELGEIDHQDESGVKWKGSTNWPVIFAIARWEKRTLLLIDTFRWFPGSLDKVCKELKLPIQKLERPAFITEGRAPRPEELGPAFEEYAMVDADAARGVLQEINGIWQAEDVGPCISLAHQAGRIFRRNYTKVEGRPVGLDEPDPFAQGHGVAAYHGGRNSLWAPELPLVLPGCTMYDFRSKYPDVASNALPSFFGGRWVWVSGGAPAVPDTGVYCVKGVLHRGDCWPYRLLMDHAGNYLAPGAFSDIWLTGFEINAALKHGLLVQGEFSWYGFHWEPGSSRRHPLRAFYKEVFARKEENRDKNPTLYTYNKNLANSLTGKFVSTIPQIQWIGGQRTKVRVPGMLFNGPVGALITGVGRVDLFEAEVQAQSVHGATDSLMVPPWGKHPLNIGPKLGQFEKVCEGTFVCGRNKLYAVLGPPKNPVWKNYYRPRGFTGELLINGKKTKVFRGQEVIKYATHAFQGSIFDFLAMVFDGTRTYSYTRMIQMREAQRRRGLTSLTMNSFTAEVKFGGKYAAGPRKG